MVGIVSPLEELSSGLTRYIGILVPSGHEQLMWEVANSLADQTELLPLGPKGTLVSFGGVAEDANGLGETTPVFEGAPRRSLGTAE